MESIKRNQTSLFNPTASKTVHTSFLDDRSIQNDDALGAGQGILDPLGKQSVSDTTAMPTHRLFSKPMLITQGTWATTAAVDTLYSDKLSNILNAQDSPANGLLGIHSYFRSGFKFTLRINSSPFHSGRLALFYTPPRTAPFTHNRTEASGYPVVYADAGNSSVVNLTVPFVTARDFVSTYGIEKASDIGTVCIFVFNQLAIGTGGPTTVGYSLWLEPISTELALPSQKHTVSLQSEDIPLTMPDLTLPNLPDIIQDVRGITTLLSQHSLKGAPSVPGLSTLVGSTKTPRDSKTMEASYAGSTPSISNMRGHRTEHLSLIPEEMDVENPFKIEGRDIDSISKIAQVPMLMRVGSWTMSQTSGTNLFTLPVTPALASTLAPTTTAAGYRDYTYLSYVAQPFQFWRGSLNYRFSVVGTQQHTGRLLATWIPSDVITQGASVVLPSLALEDLVLYPSIVFDLAENKEFNVSVPYVATSPFKFLNLQDYGTDSEHDYTNGVLYVTVLNNLTGPGTVSNSVDINLFVSAGSDIQFKGLKTERNNAFSVPYLEESASVNTEARTEPVVLHSMDVALESSKMGMEQDKVNTVAVDTPLVVLDDDQGQTDDSLKSLLSRYYPQVGFRFNVAGQSNKIFRVSQHPGLLFQRRNFDRSVTSVEFKDLICHFRHIFAFWSGSLNYFFLHNTTVNNPVLATFTHRSGIPYGATTAYPNTDVTTHAQVAGAFADNAVDLSVSSRYSHISNLRVNSAVEITLPYRSIFRRSFIELGSAGLSASTTPGTLEILYSNPSATDQLVSLQLFQSVGDDFRFQYLVPPKRYYIAALTG